MKRLVHLVLLLFIISCQLNGQSATDTGFARQKTLIDSQVHVTDTARRMTHVPFTGNLMWGDFNANCFYLVGSKKVSKLECFFIDSTAGKKVFYFYDNMIIKIIDNGKQYYYTNALFDTDGRVVKDYIARDLLFFAQEAKRMMVELLE